MEITLSRFIKDTLRKVDDISLIEFELRYGCISNESYKNGLSKEVFYKLESTLAKEIPDQVTTISYDIICYNNDKIIFEDQNIKTLNKNKIDTKLFANKQKFDIKISASTENIISNIKPVDYTYNALLNHYKNSQSTKLTRTKNRKSYRDSINMIQYDFTVVDDSLYELEIEYIGCQYNPNNIINSLLHGFKKINGIYSLSLT